MGHGGALSACGPFPFICTGLTPRKGADVQGQRRAPTAGTEGLVWYLYLYVSNQRQYSFSFLICMFPLFSWDFCAQLCLELPKLVD